MFMALMVVTVSHMYVNAQLLSPVRLAATSWTIATRLLCPWNFPGKNNGVGCHFLLHHICLCCAVLSCSVVSDSLQPARLLCPCNSPGNNTGMVAMPSSRGSSQPRERTQVSCIAGGFWAIWATKEAHPICMLLSHFSRVRLCVTPETAAHQTPPSLEFSRQEHWSGLPFLSPMHESEKSKWSRSVVSDSSQPHGLQPTRLLHPWDFPGKSTGVGCHCLLQDNLLVSINWINQLNNKRYTSPRYNNC